MPRCCCSATGRMASSIWSTGAATAISDGSIRRLRRGVAALGPTPRPASADEQHGFGGADVMEIADLLIPRGVIAQLRISNKKAALQEIARRAATLTGITER